MVPYETKLTSENALEIILDYDIVVDGTDNFPTRYLVNDACVLSGKPNVYGSILRFEGQASVFMQGILAPAGTPFEIVDQWQRELARIAARPDIRQRLATLGLEPVVNSPDAFSAYIKAEVARWSGVIRAAQIAVGE